MENRDSIRVYVDSHPSARQWVARSGKVRHHDETQSRVFRMAEQLRVAGDWPNVRPFFSILEALDDVVDAETSPGAKLSPWRASAAALVGYKILFDEPAPMQDHNWPSSFDRVEDGEVELATITLRALGFDPIVIDGLDPAAYLWAYYEMHERQGACAEVTRLHEYPAIQPRCLAVVGQELIPDGAASITTTHRERELAGVVR